MEDLDSAVKPPLDIKVEAILGAIFGLLGSVLMFSSQLNNISMIHSFQGKTLDQVNSTKGFRNIRKTRGQVFAKNLPSAVEALNKNSQLKKLVQLNWRDRLGSQKIIQKYTYYTYYNKLHKILINTLKIKSI